MAENSSSFSYSLDVRPVKEFNFESGRTKLMNLHLEEEDGSTVRFIIPGELLTETTEEEGTEVGAGRKEHLLRMSGWINMECPLTVG